MPITQSEIYPRDGCCSSAQLSCGFIELTSAQMQLGSYDGEISYHGVVESASVRRNEWRRGNLHT